MGNSNLQLTSAQSAVQKQSSSHSFETYYQNQIYGEYKLAQNQAKSIVKVYVPESHVEKNQLKDLIQRYQMARHRSIIPVVSFEAKQEPEGILYKLQLQGYECSLKQIIANKSQRFSQKEMVQLMKSIAEALAVMREAGLPFGLLTPSKIAVKKQQENRYCITSDHLMNPKLYQYEFNLNNSSVSAYLAQEELQLQNIQSKPNLAMNRSQHAVVFSLGVILLEMGLRETISKDRLKEYLIEIRRCFSYELSQILASMVSHTKRHSLTTLMQVINEYQASLQRGVVRIGQRAIKRGYNSLETLFFFDQASILPAASAKLLKKSKVT